jgi:hypothetical protein
MGRRNVGGPVSVPSPTFLTDFSAANADPVVGIPGALREPRTSALKSLGLTVLLEVVRFYVRAPVCAL